MKNPNKGFVSIIILAVIAILAIGGGVYVYKKSDSKTDSSVKAVNNKHASSSPGVSTTTSSSQKIQKDKPVASVSMQTNVQWDVPAFIKSFDAALGVRALGGIHDPVFIANAKLITSDPLFKNSSYRASIINGSNQLFKTNQLPQQTPLIVLGSKESVVAAIVKNGEPAIAYKPTEYPIQPGTTLSAYVGTEYAALANRDKDTFLTIIDPRMPFVISFTKRDATLFATMYFDSTSLEVKGLTIQQAKKEFDDGYTSAGIAKAGTLEATTEGKYYIFKFETDAQGIDKILKEFH
jgi:hypothetical protein